MTNLLTEKETLAYDDNCKDNLNPNKSPSWNTKQCIRRTKKNKTKKCKKKKIYKKKCRKTCVICCPGDTEKEGDKCKCPGDTVPYGLDKCKCPGDTVNDGNNQCETIPTTTTTSTYLISGPSQGLKIRGGS